MLDDPDGGDLVRHRGVEDDADVLHDALVRGEQRGGAFGGLEGAAGGDVSADPLPDEAFGALGARGEVDVGDDRRLRGGERERGEEEESGVDDARHGGEKWRRVLRKVAAGARAFRYFLKCSNLIVGPSDGSPKSEPKHPNRAKKSHANSASGALSIPMLVISIRSSSRSDCDICVSATMND